MNLPAQNSETLHLPDRPVRVGRIRYINVAPIYFGLDNGLRPDWLHLINHPPSLLNRMLADGSLDISPVSSAAFAACHKRWLVIPDNSISCFGNAMSVIFAGRRPLDLMDGQPVLLTDESASAAALLKLLFAMKGVKPEFRQARLANPETVGNQAQGALVIGNAALSSSWRRRFEYIWDLGAMWKEKTGLPFVFAVLAVRSQFAGQYPETVAEIARLFQISRRDGENNLKTIARRSSSTLNLHASFCETYHKTLSYDLRPEQILGLKTFFEYLHRYEIISERVDIRFFQNT